MQLIAEVDFYWFLAEPLACANFFQGFKESLFCKKCYIKPLTLNW